MLHLFCWGISVRHKANGFSLIKWCGHISKGDIHLHSLWKAALYCEGLCRSVCQYRIRPTFLREKSGPSHPVSLLHPLLYIIFAELVPLSTQPALTPGCFSPMHLTHITTSAWKVLLNPPYLKNYPSRLSPNVIFLMMIFQALLNVWISPCILTALIFPAYNIYFYHSTYF